MSGREQVTLDLYNADCLELLKQGPDNSVDAVVTDPPYGLAFLGKKWDYDVPSIEIWKEVFRVLKPGGHLLSFGGTRTYHRMVVAIEDAGFEIRDQVQWIYGSGFPKSLDVSKAIDKAAGAERLVVGQYASPEGTTGLKSKDDSFGFGMGDMDKRNITAPSTDAAKQWAGWGTALKPANEPIVLARKPLSEKTVAANVLKWGTGGINVDGCRIEGAPRTTHKDGNFTGAKSREGESTSGLYELGTKVTQVSVPQGRFPSNLLLDETAAERLDAQQAEVSRFFYVAKASKRERNEGMSEANSHPTVKPITLMRYLCRLITPTGGIVLDPFMGSGSTGIAAAEEGFSFIGIEREKDYFTIAEARLNNTLKKVS